MRKPRDYKAEYAARQALAYERGFTSYYDQRTQIEKGTAPARSLSRVRTKRTYDAQQRFNGLSWEQKVNQRELTIELAQRWSNYQSRNKMSKFDVKLAATMPGYLDAYISAFPLGFHKDENLNKFTGSPALFYYLVTLMGFMTVDEYERRYGKNH
jgi:hypothetical protein